MNTTMCKIKNCDDPPYQDGLCVDHLPRPDYAHTNYLEIGDYKFYLSKYFDMDSLYHAFSVVKVYTNPETGEETKEIVKEFDFHYDSDSIIW